MPHNYLLAIYCLAGVAYSTYTTTWVSISPRIWTFWDSFNVQDLLMDWSLFKRPARFPLLRQELVYNNHVSHPPLLCLHNLLFKMFCRRIISRSWVFPKTSSFSFTNHIPQISNIILRFVWIIYIPTGGASMQLRTFIAAVLEVLRRWQWNFCESIP